MKKPVTHTCMYRGAHVISRTVSNIYLCSHINPYFGVVLLCFCFGFAFFPLCRCCSSRLLSSSIHCTMFMSNIHACETSKLTDRACVYELHVYFIAYLLKLIRMGITFDRRPKNISRILFGRIDQSLRYRNISVRFFACCFFGNFSLKICLENSVSLKNLTGKSGRLASVSFGLSSIFSMAIGNGNVVPHSKAHQKSVFTFHLKNRKTFLEFEKKIVKLKLNLN